jgi:hypothetical protein
VMMPNAATMIRCSVCSPYAADNSGEQPPAAVEIRARADDDVQLHRHGRAHRVDEIAARWVSAGWQVR